MSQSIFRFYMELVELTLGFYSRGIDAMFQLTLALFQFVLGWELRDLRLGGKSKSVPIRPIMYLCYLHYLHYLHYLVLYSITLFCIVSHMYRFGTYCVYSSLLSLLSMISGLYFTRETLGSNFADRATLPTVKNHQPL